MSVWTAGIAVYLAIGVVFLFVGPAARMRRQEQQSPERRTSNIPPWKLIGFDCTLAIGIVAFWPILVVSAAKTERKKPKTLWDIILQSSPLQEHRNMFKLQSRLCENGIDADEFPNGQGEFGMTPSNPIPCKTVFGSNAYLDRLRAPDGSKVVYRHVGYVPSNVTPQPVDAYGLCHSNGNKLATIFISPYQRRISCKAPRGFTLGHN